MRIATTTIAVAAVCVLAAGCGKSTSQSAETTSTTPMITSFAPAPLTQKLLPRLLLSPEQINAAMSAKEMAVTGTTFEMSDDSATMAPRECLAVDGAVQAPVYADSGYTDVRSVTMREVDNNFTHYAQQAVVLFAKAEQAKAFYDASARQWPQCKEYTHTQTGTQWKAGSISDEDGTLSTIAIQTNAKAGGWACGRALTANNNVVVDVNTCSPDPADSAVAIAKQISALVDSPPPVRP